MNFRVIVLFAALAVAACHRAAPVAEAPLAGVRLGGPFALVDQDGRRVTERSWPGRYRIMYFGYTFCPDVCPTDAQAIGQGLKLLAARDAATAAKIQPIFVTVDPRRDTATVLKQFVRAFSPTMEGLTGSDAAVARAAKAYGAFYKVEPPQPGARGYLVDHSRQAVLYGPDGGPIALLPTDRGGQAVADELAQWVR